MKGNEYIYGLHAVEAFLANNEHLVSEVFISASRQDHRIKNIQEKAKKNGIRVTSLPGKQLDKMVEGCNHQGAVAFIMRSKSYNENDLEILLDELQEPAFLLILDGVQDPHNLGACIRTANAAGVHAMIVPKDRAAGITAAVRKVACGAVEATPFITVTNLARAIRKLQDRGIWIYGAAPKADATLYELNMVGSVGLVLGAEGSGLRQLTEKTCDGLFNIPMFGVVESLNVSVATGICLFEVVRQRHG